MLTHLLADRFWLTLIHAFGLIVLRDRYNLHDIRCNSMTIEPLLMLAWFGVGAGMTYEATLPQEPLAAPYDALGKTLIAFCYIEG